MAVRCAVLDTRCSTTETTPWVASFRLADPHKIPIDPNGNLTSKTEGSDNWVYTWNAENQLTKVEKNGTEVARYAYDPVGRRIERIAGGETAAYTFDGVNTLRETTGGSVRKYVLGPNVDEPLAADDGAPRYYHSDIIGSIVRVTNAAGDVTATRQYDAWGNLQSGSTAAGHAFTGREWDPETGLYYYRARYYSPTVGRFITEDPSRLMAGPNFYTYVDDNPVNRTDPTGLIGQYSEPRSPRPPRTPACTKTRSDCSGEYVECKWRIKIGGYDVHLWCSILCHVAGPAGWTCEVACFSTIMANHAVLERFCEDRYAECLQQFRE